MSAELTGSLASGECSSAPRVGAAGWAGEVVLHPGRLIYAGRIGDAHRHHHAAAQVVLAISEPVRLRDEHGDGWRGRAALVPPGVPHEIDGGGTGILIFVDVSGRLGEALAGQVLRTGLPTRSVAAWAAAARPLLGLGGGAERDLIELADAAVRALVGEVSAPSGPRHPVLRQALAVVRVMVGGPVRLADVAAEVGISASRLGHLFSEELGLPFRPYLRWVRLRHAMDRVVQGGTLTDAAHAAGFADSAHLTHVCHEMFGLAPSQMAAAVKLTQS